MLLRGRAPIPGEGGVRKGVLSWLYRARPSVIGRLYTLELRVKEGDTPSVIVRCPDVVALSQGNPLPHVYSENPPTLCLYRPGKSELRPTDALVDTIIPWSIEWLHYFEIWLRTGKWEGGGEHPGAPA